jgi:hypothetical protein
MLLILLAWGMTTAADAGVLQACEKKLENFALGLSGPVGYNLVFMGL